MINNSLANDIVMCSKYTQEVIMDLDYIRQFTGLVVQNMPLGPDETADIKRIPKDVHTLSELYSWLSSLQTLITNDAPTCKKNGVMRTYKNIVCVCHAIFGWTKTTEASLSATFKSHSSSVMLYANSNKPMGLSTKAGTLWEKTFGSTSSRIKMDIILILRIATCEVEVSGGVELYTVQNLIDYELREEDKFKDYKETLDNPPKSEFFEKEEEPRNRGSSQDSEYLAQNEVDEGNFKKSSASDSNIDEVREKIVASKLQNRIQTTINPNYIPPLMSGRGLYQRSILTPPFQNTQAIINEPLYDPSQSVNNNLVNEGKQ